MSSQNTKVDQEVSTAERHPDARQSSSQSLPVKTVESQTAQPGGPAPSSSKGTGKRSSFIDRALSKKNQATAKRFFSAYAQTWVGLSPIWLMGEALTPGTKIGTQLWKGSSNLVNVAEEVRAAVSTGTQDIVVIVDEKLRAGQVDVTKTAEVLKAAGDDAILVVSSSLEKAREQLRRLNTEYGPKIRRSVSRNGRDVIVVLDKALKNPIVVTGVSKFAKSKGIPHADALLRLASLGLARIMHAIPEENLEGAEAIVEEIDAAELERTSSSADNVIAMEIGQQGDEIVPQTKTADESPKDPYEKMKRDSCIIA